MSLPTNGSRPRVSCRGVGRWLPRIQSIRRRARSSAFDCTMFRCSGVGYGPDAWAWTPWKYACDKAGFLAAGTPPTGPGARSTSAHRRIGARLLPGGRRAVPARSGVHDRTSDIVEDGDDADCYQPPRSGGATLKLLRDKASRHGSNERCIRCAEPFAIRHSPQRLVLSAVTSKLWLA